MYQVNIFVILLHLSHHLWIGENNIWLLKFTIWQTKQKCSKCLRQCDICFSRVVCDDCQLACLAGQAGHLHASGVATAMLIVE